MMRDCLLWAKAQRMGQDPRFQKRIGAIDAGDDDAPDAEALYHLTEGLQLDDDDDDKDEVDASFCQGDDGAASADGGAEADF